MKSLNGMIVAADVVDSGSAKDGAIKARNMDAMMTGRQLDFMIIK